MFNLKVAPACPLVHLARPTKNELAAVVTARMFPCGFKQTTSLHPVDIASAPLAPHRPTKVSGECGSARAARRPSQIQADEMSGTTPTMNWETVKFDSISPQHASAFKSAVKQGLIQIVVTEGGEYLMKVAKDHLVPPLKEFFNNLPEKAEEGWHSVKSLAEEVGHEIKLVSNVVDVFGPSILDAVGEAFKQAGKDVANGIEDAAKSVANGVADAAKSVANGVADAAKSVWKWISS